jgi:hypothetical protein
MAIDPKCGTITPSGCIAYTGPVLKGIPKEQVSCNPSLNTILENLANIVDGIKAGMDTTNLDLSCLSGLSATELMDVIRGLIALSCDLKTRVEEVEDKTSSASLLGLPVTFDLSCLADSPCYDNATTIQGLLQLLVTEICILKSR